MGMPVGELLARMPEREFLEWMAFYRIEPWGDERADLRAGVIASTVANVSGTVRKGQRPYRPGDFALKFGGAPAAYEAADDDPEAAIDKRRTVAKATREMFEARIGPKGAGDGRDVQPAAGRDRRTAARPADPGNRR
jgi:hypothetical protein